MGKELNLSLLVLGEGSELHFSLGASIYIVCADDSCLYGTFLGESEGFMVF